MKDYVVLVTGCSSGIGRSAAALLAAEGFTVVATARKTDSIADLPVAMKLPLDVTDQASVDAAVAAVVDRFGKIDILVNNAGLSVRACVEEIDEARSREMFDVNVWGLIRVSKAVIAGMRERASGRIINVGSVVGKFTWPANGAYSASKHAVEALSDAMRLELKPFGIGVALVEPGTIDSSFMDTSIKLSAGAFDDERSPYAPIYDAFKKMANNPARRGAPSESVARVILEAARAKKPKTRYLAAVSPLYRSILSMGDGARDRLMTKVFSLGSLKTTFASLRPEA